MITKEEILKKCKDYAINKNGLCLSEEYKSITFKMLWRCQNLHEWKANWNNIRNGSWCPKCSKLIQSNKLKADIKELQQFAIEKNGKLLSDKYINALSKILWQCENAHQWEANWNDIKNNKTWCPYCAGLNKPNISELQQFAINKNGKLISSEYINSRTNLLWECSEGHQWAANWHNIKDRNSWCPNCSLFKTEKLCKQLLEENFGFKFMKQRFYYNNQRLEFDGYNEENKIAFEYHGIQHYEFPNCWHKTEQEFIEAQKRDDLKEQFAAENNIRLIIIPYTEERNLQNYIINLVKNV
jgi:thiol-disulfide isomerase/thioredoxin